MIVNIEEAISKIIEHAHFQKSQQASSQRENVNPHDGIGAVPKSWKSNHSPPGKVYPKHLLGMTHAKPARVKYFHGVDTPLSNFFLWNFTKTVIGFA